MILAFSTSSPLARVALISDRGEIVAEGERLAPRKASEACLEILETIEGWRSATIFAADLGPGSFTGVRVGVTLAKTLAFAAGACCAGVSSFDLIDAQGPVIVPSRKGEAFLRIPGESPIRIAEAPPEASGYGEWREGQELYPHARRFALLVDDLKRVEPEALLPEYVLPPSITPPKRAYREGAQ